VADLLQQHHDFEREEVARVACCRAILAVQSHYHHIVSPAMIARGDCNERLGRLGVARQIYDAVIADFRWLVDEFDTDPESLDDGAFSAIGNLARAVERRLVLAPPPLEDLAEMLIRCKRALDYAANTAAG
jgi:hypothetical protein